MDNETVNEVKIDELLAHKEDLEYAIDCASDRGDEDGWEEYNQELEELEEEISRLIG